MSPGSSYGYREAPIPGYEISKAYEYSEYDPPMLGPPSEHSFTMANISYGICRIGDTSGCGCINGGNIYYTKNRVYLG